MFGKDFYPTPSELLDQILEGENIKNKICFEPSAGKGNIVDYLIFREASQILACENNKDLALIIKDKCTLIAEDFLSVTSDMISHVELIVMNPPFSADEKHIRHAWEIAPGGCKIIALCNAQTIDNPAYESRRILKSIVEGYGYFDNLGNVFKTAERETFAEIGLIKMQKPGKASNEFDGFFTHRQDEDHFNGIIPYNLIRDLVNRYVGAVKIFDKQLEAAIEMNRLTESFFSSELAISIKAEKQTLKRAEFKKELQKQAWMYLFNKLDMDKFTTRGLRDDINKFVEKQEQFPFSMQNIYRMLEIIIGTQDSRMDKAILDVFEKLTNHYHDNRYNVEGWKTNSHYLVNRKFILPNITDKAYNGSMRCSHSSYNVNLIEDLQKALCYLTGEDFNKKESLWNYLNRKPDEDKTDPMKRLDMYYWNTWYNWGFFRMKGFMKGTMHFEFKDEKVWDLFNQKVGKLKGFALYEKVKTKPVKNKKSYTANTSKPVSKKPITEFETLATFVF
jgi:hypothetical protein